MPTTTEASTAAMAAQRTAPPLPFGRLPERTQHALGTEVRAVGLGADRSIDELQRLEAILTRFQPSPLTRLNQAGVLRRPPLELVEALRHALTVAAETDGLVTPTVLPALRWAGYRDSWPAPARPSTGAPPAITGWWEVSVADDAIHLPAGAAIDLGGTAKSWIVERCFEILDGEALLDAGGDLVSRSEGPVAIDIAHPMRGDSLQFVLPAGRWGIATSGVLARAWPSGHHLIDPRTARPARPRFVQATAVHADLRRAEVLTKLALLAPDAPALAEAAALVAFDAEGNPWHHRAVGHWERA